MPAAELRAIATCDQSDGALKEWAQEKLEELNNEPEAAISQVNPDYFHKKIESMRKSTSCDYQTIVKDVACFGEDMMHFIEQGQSHEERSNLNIQAHKFLDEMASAVEQKLKIRCGCQG